MPLTRSTTVVLKRKSRRLSRAAANANYSADEHAMWSRCYTCAAWLLADGAPSIGSCLIKIEFAIPSVKSGSLFLGSIVLA